MKTIEKRKVTIIVVAILVLVLTIGGAYALWTYSKTLGNQSIVAGDIYMKYTGTNNLSITNAMPSLTYSKDDYFEFNIVGKNTHKEDIVYEIVLNHGDEPEDEERTERIKDGLLKFRLVSVQGKDEEELIQEGSFDSINNTKIWVDRVKADTKEEIIYTYRLYMWISNDTKIGNTDGAIPIEKWNKTFASVKVTVNGDFNEKELTEDYLILNAKNESGQPYDLKQPIQSDEDITITLGSKREITNFVVSKSSEYPVALTSLEEPTSYPASYNETTRAWEATITLEETGIYDYYAVYPNSKGNSKTHSFTILMNPDRFVKVEKPTSAICKSGLIYSGSPQDLIAKENLDKEGYTITQVQGTDANTYEITAKLKDTNKFKWNDSTTNDAIFSCTIEPKEIIITPRSGQKKEYNATEPTLTYDYTGNLANETPSFTGKLGRENGTDVGTYLINLGTLELVDKEPFKKNNYKLKLSELPVNFEITKTALTLKMSAKGANAIKNSTGEYTVEANAKGNFTISLESETYATITSIGTSNSSKATFNLKANNTAGVTNINISFTATEGASNYNEATVNEKFQVNVISSGTTSTVIKATLGNPAGVVGVTSNNEATTSSSSSIRDYRYSGLGVGNYVFFNDELWRIIGIVDGNVKIVRNEVLSPGKIPYSYIVNEQTFVISKGTGGYWDYTSDPSTEDNNNWANAGLMYWLNSEGTTDGYSKTLTGDAQNMIYEEAKWYLGNAIFDDTAVQSYENERKSTKCNSSITSSSHENNCYVWANNQSTWPGKIALMYPSDYGFSFSDSYWNTSKMYQDYQGNSSIRATSWLQQEANHKNSEWLLSPTSRNTKSVFHWAAYGEITLSDTYATLAIRPTLYLKSTVQIIGGQGTENSPYQLQI